LLTSRRFSPEGRCPMKFAASEIDGSGPNLYKFEGCLNCRKLALGKPEKTR
jgi:hypothetical protein